MLATYAQGIIELQNSFLEPLTTRNQLMYGRLAALLLSFYLVNLFFQVILEWINW